MLNDTITHEMMQPLSCIVYFSKKLARYFKDNEKRKMLSLIETSAKLLNCQLKDLLDQNLVKTGQLVPNYELVSPNEIVHEAF